MAVFHLSIITPQGKVFEGNIESISAPGTEGSFGVLKKHAPMVSQLKKGRLFLKTAEGSVEFLTAPGVLEVDQNGNVTILADSAEKVAV